MQFNLSMYRWIVDMKDWLVVDQRGRYFQMLEKIEICNEIKAETFSFI